MTTKTIFALVLAAGESSRFGSTKQLVPVDGRPLVLRAMQAAETVCRRRTILVAGHEWRDVTAACAPMQGFFVVNPHYRDGLAGSIRAGLGAVSECADAVLLMLADQALVTAEHLQDLIDTWRTVPDSIVASAYAGTCGPPVIFPRAFFPALLSIEGDRGAKPLLEANPERLHTVSFEDAAVDIDRPSDLIGGQ